MKGMRTITNVLLLTGLFVACNVVAMEEGVNNVEQELTAFADQDVFNADIITKDVRTNGSVQAWLTEKMGNVKTLAASSFSRLKKLLTRESLLENYHNIVDYTKGHKLEVAGITVATVMTAVLIYKLVSLKNKKRVCYSHCC